MNLNENINHAKNKAIDSIVTNHTRFLQLLKPKGIGPTNPPTYILVLEVVSFEPIKAPKKTIKKPIKIKTAPKVISCSILGAIYAII